MRRVRCFTLLLGCCLVAMLGIRTHAEDVDGGGSVGPFAFAAVCGQYPGVAVESESITVTTTAEALSVAVVNGEYSVNGGPYTAEPGTVSHGQTVSVRHLAASGESPLNSTVLTIGGRSALFTSSTEPCLRGTW